MALGLLAASKVGMTKMAESMKKKEIESTEGKEVKPSEFTETAQKKDALEPDIDKVKKVSLESLIQENKEKASEINENGEAIESFDVQKGMDGADENINDTREAEEDLTDEEKRKIKEETDWFDEIIDNIRSIDEYEIYKKAGLQEVEIGNRKALIRNDIDWSQIDEKGRSNAERIKRGLAPLDKDRNPIELHHIGQHIDSPLAELTFKEHRCDGNDTILHDKKKETETHGDGNSWDNERQNYWKERTVYNEGVKIDGRHC